MTNDRITFNVRFLIISDMSSQKLLSMSAAAKRMLMNLSISQGEDNIKDLTLKAPQVDRFNALTHFGRELCVW